MSFEKFSPVRAVMFWGGDYKCPLLRLGMFKYVFEPLRMDFPEGEKDVEHAVNVVFEYASMAKLYFEKDLIQLIENTKQSTGRRSKPSELPFWKTAVKYRYSMIEPMAMTKSMNMSQHVASATSFEKITPNPVINIRDLAYSDNTLHFLHNLVYKRFHENPVSLVRSIVKYMNDNSDASNIYICNILYSLVKAHKAGLGVNLILRTRGLPKGCLCLGKNNVKVKRVLDAFTIKMCPWCYKPVNVVYKKKSSVGGSHKSEIFTDEYTNRPLYCTEKNHRGIMVFPLISFDGRSFFVNDLEWKINSGFSRVFTIESYTNGIRMVVLNKLTQSVIYVPIEVDVEECGDTCLICINKK